MATISSGKASSALIPETEDYGAGAVRFFQCRHRTDRTQSLSAEADL